MNPRPSRGPKANFQAWAKKLAGVGQDVVFHKPGHTFVLCPNWTSEVAKMSLDCL